MRKLNDEIFNDETVSGETIYDQKVCNDRPQR